MTQDLLSVVEEELAATQIIDMHTHLFKPSLGAVGLWGIDELVTYHYLEAELFRSHDISPDQYWALSKREQADLIWHTLFVENQPVSEATRGVVAVLQAFDLPTDSLDLSEARKFFSSQTLEAHIGNVFRLAGISEAVMTNDPLDAAEAPLWRDSRSHNLFHAVLRIDRVLEKWPEHWQKIQSDGYRVEQNLTPGTVAEIRRFLADWCTIMKPVYMAVSLSDDFRFPENSIRSQLLKEAVLPACREFAIPLSLMIGVRRQVNPAIRLAGDGVGRADLRAVENLCRDFPHNRFLASLLSRENQHELCVYARKFNNLMPFGCWWFLNNPSVVEEITRERIEMLGMSFIPQHSDARVLEQVIYKWRNTRRTMAPILAHSYALLVEDGRPVAREHVRQDLDRLFRKNFQKFCGISS
jgi:hypothetical protein